MSRDNSEDAGAPLPDFRAPNIQLQTIAPALGVSGSSATPDYLDYDPKGRGIFGTTCANAGVAYIVGTSMGGIYGFRSGLQATPSSRFRVQLNSVLNHSGRYGSRAGNVMGVFAVLYSLYEGISDQYEVDEKLGIGAVSPLAASFVSPAIGATLASATYFVPSGFRVASLAGSIGFGAVSATYALYTMLGIPYGSGGFLFF